MWKDIYSSIYKILVITQNSGISRFGGNLEMHVEIFKNVRFPWLLTFQISGNPEILGIWKSRILDIAHCLHYHASVVWKALWLSVLDYDDNKYIIFPWKLHILHRDVIRHRIHRHWLLCYCDVYSLLLHFIFLFVKGTATRHF